MSDKSCRVALKNRALLLSSLDYQAHKKPFPWAHRASQLAILLGVCHGHILCTFNVQLYNFENEFVMYIFAFQCQFYLSSFVITVTSEA